MQHQRWNWEYRRSYSVASRLPWKMLPTVWHANKIKRVVRSTIAAETLSLQEGIESSFYCRKMLENIIEIPHKTIPIIAYVDNRV